MRDNIMDNLTFVLEQRGTTVCVVDKNGGVRPASNAEQELWSALGAYSERVSALESKCAQRTRDMQRAQREEMRLRSALEEIVSWCPHPDDPDKCGIAECAVARRALSKQECEPCKRGYCARHVFPQHRLNRYALTNMG
ncbi:unnamed protein product [Sphagnum balticum]